MDILLYTVTMQKNVVDEQKNESANLVWPQKEEGEMAWKKVSYLSPIVNS